MNTVLLHIGKQCWIVRDHLAIGPFQLPHGAPDSDTFVASRVEHVHYCKVLFRYCEILTAASQHVFLVDHVQTELVWERNHGDILIP